MRGTIVALAALLLTSPAAAAPSLEVALEPATATIGDLITTTLTLRGAPADPARPPRFPDWTRGWGALEVREAGPAELVSAADGPLWRQQIRLAAFRTGLLPLPPVTVTIPSDPPLAVATPDELSVEIGSVLPADRQQWTRQPPADPVALELPRAFWWTAAALAVVALAAALAMARRARRERSATLTPLSPWDELARALDRLELAEPGTADAAISLALRRYLGRVFSMPAAQSSTTELGRRLARRGLPAELVRRTATLLRAVDQVKFALAEATVEQTFRRRDAAREIAAAIERHLRPPQQEAAA